jgi:pyruvate dehydrogenase E2 component (dihydrolipoamide acetyltransferase)
MSARVASTPLARKLARSAGVALSQIRGSGPGGRVVAADLRLAGMHASRLPGTHPGKGEGCVAGTISCHSRRITSTPYARRLARTRRIDLARIAGSGPAGRIVARDLERSAVLSIELATEAAAALCAHLNRALAKGAAPIVVADIITAAVARATRDNVAWTIDGIRPTWSVAPEARLTAIAQARTIGVATEALRAVLLRAVVSRARTKLTIALPPGENRSDTTALAAQIRDTIAWPIGLLL